ncbi:MAG: hypothetical protein H6Q44_1215, partial [Deltaproteobacteria bacterium]|nr:hypothetical protein [Deltaproteobacteria bacterium]
DFVEEHGVPIQKAIHGFGPVI